jgi:hypothetical protein
VASDAALDNDVVLKLACYSLLSDLLALYEDGQAVGVLGAARFVLPTYIKRDRRIRDKGAASTALASFLRAVELLEPTPAEVALATAFEEAAVAASVSLDVGESQLCAIVLTRNISALVTGDKRAITGAEQLLETVEALRGLAGRIVCLEQLIHKIFEHIGYGIGRDRVCAEPAVDTALRMCCACNSSQCGQIARDRIREALLSYINDLRRLAPKLLHPSDIYPAN